MTTLEGRPNNTFVFSVFNFRQKHKEVDFESNKKFSIFFRVKVQHHLTFIYISMVYTKCLNSLIHLTFINIFFFHRKYFFMISAASTFSKMFGIFLSLTFLKFFLKFISYVTCRTYF